MVDVFYCAFLFGNDVAILYCVARYLWWRALLLLNSMANFFFFVLTDLLVNILANWDPFVVTFFYWFVFTHPVYNGCADIFQDFLHFIHTIGISSEVVPQTSCQSQFGQTYFGSNQGGEI